MSTFHDPNRQISYIQQCLSNNRKPLGLFLGAGCPLSIQIEDGDRKEPLIPDIAGITELISKALKESESFQVVVTHLQEDGVEINVESILSHIRALKAVSGASQVRGLTSDALEELDQSICSRIQNIVSRDLPNTLTAYHWTAGWIAARSREYSVELFTTNYDLLLEQALEERQVPYFDGFVGGCKPSFDLQAIEDDTISPRWARLAKIHGSINWYFSESRGVYRSHSSETVAKRVIHPSHLKYAESRRMPYLAMMDRLRNYLKKPHSMLAIIGYSFHDEHINEVILQGLQSNPSAIVFGLLFSTLDSYPEASQLASTQTNLSVLAKDAAIIGSVKSKWTGDVQTKNDSSWITWKESKPEQDPKLYQAKFMLGDFMVFGQFLRNLAGMRDEPQAGEDEA